MFALDLFNNDHERHLAEGAVDKLEQRRIDDLAMKMDDLVARAKQATTPEVKAALVKEFKKCKAERDSYYKISNETMGYGTLVGEGQMKQMMHKDAERMERVAFMEKYGNEEWVGEFWDNVNGPLDEDTEEDDVRGRIENSTHDLVGYLKDMIDGDVPSADNILDSMNDAYGYDSDASEAELAKDQVATAVRKVISAVWEELDAGGNEEVIAKYMPAIKKAYQIATTNGYGQENVNEGSFKDMLWKLAERMERDEFIDHCASELGQDAVEMGEFWDSINGPLNEGSMKDAMWHDAERMNRNQFCSKWGQEHGEFWDNIMGGLDEATSGNNDKVLRKKYGNAINKYFSQIYNYGDDGLEHLDNSSPSWGIMFDYFNGDVDTLIAQTDIVVLKALVKELKDTSDDLKIGMVEAGIGQDLVNKQEKMARATPSTPTGKVASTVKNAAKWLAGKGGPGKEGPTYESAQKKNSEEVDEAGGGWALDPKTRLELQKRKQRNKTIAKWAGRPVPPQDTKEKEVAEGWSDAVVAQRTGRPRTPYSVYIKGKKWKDFENDDHAEAVANKLRAKFKAEGRDPSVITIAPTDYDKDMEESATAPIIIPKRRAKAKPEPKFDIPYSADDYVPPALAMASAEALDRIIADPSTKETTRELAKRARAEKKKGVAEAEGRVDPILLKALKRMPDGLATHREVLDAAYDAYAIEKGYLAMKGNHGVTDVYIPKLMGLYKDKHGLTFNEDQEDDWYDEEESDLQNGSYVVDTQDHSGEVYRVSQYEPGARRCWIGDRDGRGWYISPDRLEIIDDTAKINRYFGKKRDLDEEQDTSGVEQAILHRIMVAHTDLLKQFGPQKVMQAAEEVAYNVGDVDEIGTSDVSAYVDQVRQILGA